jgi:hypothetical protein
MFAKVIFNLATPNKRYEMLEGKRYLVVPAVALTVGVHNGSDGPYYYPPEELAKNPGVWNHKPIVVYHPMMNGDGVSACDPDVIRRQGVGLIFNSAWDGRLRQEAWLEEDKLRQVDPRVLDAINNGTMLEVSTGLWQDPEMTPGTWQGEQYKGIVRNIQPDHLAILPDQRGSCSIADGAGLLRNRDSQALIANADHNLSATDVKDHVEHHLNGGKPYGDHYVHEVYPKHVIYDKGGKLFKHGYKVGKSGKAELHGEPEEVRRQTSYVTCNGQPIFRNEDQQGPVRLPQPHVGELSDVMKHQQMQKALEEHYSGITQEGDWGGWVTDLYANYVVWSKDGKQWRLPYTYDDDKIRFDGEPEEIERVSEYRTRRQTPIDGTSSPYNVNSAGGTTVPTPQRPTQNAIHQGAHQLMHDPTGHSDAHHAPGGQSDSQVRTTAGGARKDAVNKMMGKGWAEEDRSFLEGLPDDHFERVQKFTERGYSTPIQPYSYDGIGDRSNAHGAGSVGIHQNAQNGQPQRPSVDQYIGNAPPEIREVLMNAMAVQNAEKTRLIQIIMNSPSNRFSDKWLAQQDMNMLRGMAQLAGGGQGQVASRPVANYAGQADTPMFLDNQQGQQNGQGFEPTVLPIPQLTWNSNGN